MSQSSIASRDLFLPSAQPWTPHAYQKRAARFLIEHSAAALFLDPGLGKSSIVLAALKVLNKQLKRRHKVLVIAPLRVVYNVWPKEVEKWSDFEDFKVAILHGPRKQEALNADADLYVINPEGLDWLLAAEKSATPSGRKSVAVDPKRFAKLGFDILVVDELSKFRYSSTQRFKAMKAVLPTFGRRWGLTGSPAANGLLGLFGQCYMLDLGKALGQFVTHYRNRFFFPVDFNGWVWKPKAGAEEEIYERIAPLALRMSAEDYLALPELIETTLKIDLPKGAREVYQALENDLFVELENEESITALSSGAAANKCRQVASGGVYIDDRTAPLLKARRGGVKEWSKLHDLKTDIVEEIFEELQGQPLLVAYEFKHDLERLLERFGKDMPFIGGGVTPKRADQIVEEWNRGELPMLAVHPASAGHGLNLQEGGASHVVWYTPTWDYELYDQLNRRIRRQGSKTSRVFVYRIVAKDTVEEEVIGALGSKARGQGELFEALKALARKRRRG